MAWALRWQLSFKDRDDLTHTVGIYDDGWTGEVTTLTPAASPFETKEDGDGDIFTAVRKQVGYLRVVTSDTSLLNHIIPKTNTDRMVLMTHQETVEGSTITTTEWIGFMQAQAFEQPWKSGYREIEFPLNGLLAALNDVMMPLSERVEIRSMREVIQIAIESLKIEDYITGVTIADCYSTTGAWLDAVVNCRVFFSSEIIDNEGSSTVEHISKSYYNMMESICQLFGVTLREDGGRLYFIDYFSDVIGGRQLRLAEYDWEDFIDATYTPTTTTQSLVQLTALLATPMGTDNVAGFILGKKSVRVVTEISDASPLEISMPVTTEDDSEVLSHITQNGIVYLQRHDIRTGSIEEWYYTYYNSSGVEQRDTSLEDAYHVFYYSAMNSNTSFPATTGAFPCRWFFKKNGETQAVILKNGILMNLQNTQLIDAAWNDANRNYVLRGEEIISLSGGYIIINMELHDFYYTFFDWQNENGTEVNIRCTLKYGKVVVTDGVETVETRYWDGDNSQWSTSPTAAFTITLKGGRIATNKTTDMLVEEEEGYFIPLDGDMRGTIEFAILNRFSYSAIGTRSRVTYIMQELDISYGMKREITASSRSSNSYYKSLLTSGFSHTRTLTGSLGTMNNNVQSLSFIKDGEGNYLSAFDYIAHGLTRTYRPELYVLNQMARYFIKSRRTYRQICNAVQPLCAGRWQYDGNIFMAISAKRKWREKTSNVKLLEIMDLNN